MSTNIFLLLLKYTKYFEYSFDIYINIFKTVL